MIFEQVRLVSNATPCPRHYPHEEDGRGTHDVSRRARRQGRVPALTSTPCAALRLRELRLGTFDALVGINLLREGLDLPEVSCVDPRRGQGRLPALDRSLIQVDRLRRPERVR